MRECGGMGHPMELESGAKGGLGAAEEGEGLCLGGRLAWWVTGRNAIWPLRLRLHSGLRQSGAHSSRKKPRDGWGTRLLRGGRGALRGVST
jgi:hypothetical protein